MKGFIILKNTENHISPKANIVLLLLLIIHLPPRQTCHRNEKWIQKTGKPEWMTKGKIILIQKDSLKETIPNNYRPITCLPMMWKILTAQIREEIYYSLISRGIFPGEQKGCCKRTRGTEEQLYLDQHPLNESKTLRKNIAVAWIDYKKVYDMVLQRWILHCLKMYKIPDLVIQFIKKTMKT